MPFKIIKQEEIEITISNSNKAVAYSNIGYPLNDLDDRIFEILTYSIFKCRLLVGEKPLIKLYDDVVLMQGVGEKGVDCFLKKGDKITAIIQCKKYSKNLSEAIIVNELVKFCLHLIIDSSNFELNKKFTYYIATSTGFTGKANLLYAKIHNKNFFKTYGLENIVRGVINKYKEFKNLSYQDIESRLFKLLKSFDYQLIGPNDYNLWINDFKEIIETFFQIRKVTDNALIEEKSQEIIEILNKSRNDNFNFSKFLKTYTEIVAEKLNVVNFIGFDIQRHRQRPDDITLTDLFVQPSFKQRIVEKNEKVRSIIERELKITNLFKSENCIVILGDPGAGKSLLVKFIIVSILKNNAERIGLKQFSTHLPIRIELRKYNEKREKNSIIQYLSEQINQEYQIKISHNQIEEIFDSHPVLIFFDGLDEIFNTNHKVKTKEAIEAFSLRYPMSKCVVTSRFIGYHDIKFNPKKFDEFAIIKFDNNQIRELVTNFYHTQHSSEEKRRNAIEGCLRQINDDVDEELKSNPLILTLILILTSNNIIIPDSKLEIYESCTKTLVDSIDINEKELRIEIPVANKNFTFCHLAHWQYVSQSCNAEINYDTALNEVAYFLLNRNECNDFKDAEVRAAKFLDYAERRSIYFENNFTHKTFLEYFTAEFLYSSCIAIASDNGRRKLLAIINQYLSSSFWYIVFELLFIRIDSFQPNNDLLDELFSSQLQSSSLDVFYFLISNIVRFKNISRAVRKKIILRTIMLCIKGEKMKNSGQLRLSFDEGSIVFKLHLLLNDTIHSIILQEIFTELESEKLTEKQLVELYNLHFEISSYYEPTKEKLIVAKKEQLLDISTKDLLLYSHVNFGHDIRKRKLSIDVLFNQIEYFGTKSIFNYISFRYTETSQRIDTFDLFLINAIELNDYDLLRNVLYGISQYGLKEEAITNHVRITNVYYFIRSHNLDKILKLFLKSKDRLVDKVLMLLLNRSDNNMQFAYQKFKTENSHPKLRLVDKIFESKSSSRLKF
ncbi:MAG TPA: NACHT domain-containing protein [Mucilaginibacter sp.]|jgi:hypothetical protein|nr:NACHT domain-containing protein [Mucilaginibacter sp.]